MADRTGTRDRQPRSAVASLVRFSQDYSEALTFG
jgi:hypothetical protein